MEKVFRLRIKILKDKTNNLVVKENANIVVYDDDSLMGYISDEQGVSHILAGVYCSSGFLIRSYGKLDDIEGYSAPEKELWTNTNNFLGAIFYYGYFIEKHSFFGTLKEHRAMAELEWISNDFYEEDINEIINILKEEIDSLTRTNLSLIRRIEKDKNINRDEADLRELYNLMADSDIDDVLFYS